MPPTTCRRPSAPKEERIVRLRRWGASQVESQSLRQTWRGTTPPIAKTAPTKHHQRREENSERKWQHPMPNAPSRRFHPDIVSGNRCFAIDRLSFFRGTGLLAAPSQNRAFSTGQETSGD